MANNISVTAGSGTTLKTTDNSGVHTPYHNVDVLAAAALDASAFGAKADAKSTATDTTAISAMSIWKQISASVQAFLTSFISVKTRFFAVAASAKARPANTTAYSANDAVSDNATAGSVTAFSWAVSNVNDDPISLERLQLVSTDTGAAGQTFRMFLYRSDPTASTGVVGGDNAAFSTRQGTFIGTMTGTLRTFSDGSGGVLIPDEGSRIITNPTSGAQTVFGLLQTLTGWTPSANSTTFTPTLEGFQGRA
jgi:hypothetical protein